jgi:hypothetical protein
VGPGVVKLTLIYNSSYYINNMGPNMVTQNIAVAILAQVPLAASNCPPHPPQLELVFPLGNCSDRDMLLTAGAVLIFFGIVEGIW